MIRGTREKLRVPTARCEDHGVHTARHRDPSVRSEHRTEHSVLRTIPVSKQLLHHRVFGDAEPPRNSSLSHARSEEGVQRGTGSVPARVHDPGPAVRAFKAQSDTAICAAVGRETILDERTDTLRTPHREFRNSFRIAQPGPRGERVRSVCCRIVARTDRRGHATLRQSCVSAAERVNARAELPE